MARRKIADQRRQEIIAGLYDCLATHGHEQVTIKDIAKAAHVSYGSLHYYFKNKKEIIFALVEDFVKQNEQIIQNLISPIESPWERLRTITSFLIREFVFDQRISNVFLNLYQMGCHDDDIRRCLMGSYAHFRKAIRDIVEYGISREEFSHVDPEEFALLFVSSIEGFYLQIAMDPTLCEQETVERIIYENARLHLDPKLTAVRQNGAV
jgi:TetR/AcrR family transcriptional repressor of bet genes